jgi:predicted DNA-binding protein with PD1-like motif
MNTHKQESVTHSGADRIFADTGADAIAVLGDFASERDIETARFSAIGGFERATVGWFDRDRQAFRQIEVDEPCEVLSLLGGIVRGENGPEVRAQVVLGLADGRTRGGLLLAATVGPSLDIVIGEVSPAPRPARVSLRARVVAIACGIALVLLGAWGALIPFIGPSFDFGFGADATWQWSSARGWLEVLPGAVAAVGGLVMIISPSRLVVGLGGLVAATAGGWFIVGQSLAGLLRIGSVGAPIGTRPGITSLESLALFYGLGGLMLLLVAFVLGRLSIRGFAGAATVLSDGVDLPLTAVAPAPGESRSRWEGIAAPAH